MLAEAQRAGVEPVLIGGGRRADDRPVQLRVLTHRDVKAALARKNPGLLRHALPGAVHLIPAHVHVRRPGH